MTVLDERKQCPLNVMGILVHLIDEQHDEIGFISDPFNLTDQLATGEKLQRTVSQVRYCYAEVFSA